MDRKKLGYDDTWIVHHTDNTIYIAEVHSYCYTVRAWSPFTLPAPPRIEGVIANGSKLQRYGRLRIWGTSDGLEL